MTPWERAQAEWAEHCQKHTLQEEFNTYASMATGFFVALAILAVVSVIGLPLWVAGLTLLIGFIFFLAQAIRTQWMAQEIPTQDEE